MGGRRATLAEILPGVFEFVGTDEPAKPYIMPKVVRKPRDPNAKPIQKAPITYEERDGKVVAVIKLSGDLRGENIMGMIPSPEEVAVESLIHEIQRKE